MKFVPKHINDKLNRDLEHSAYEMATVGYFYEKKGNKPKGEPIKVSVTDDCGKPQVHVHLTRRKGELLNCCIKLDSPEYFDHGLYKDFLSNEQINLLIEFFKSTPRQPVFNFNGESYKLRTNWDYTIIQWNEENQLSPKVWIDIGKDENGYIITPPMPDYTKLNRGGK